MVTAGDHRFRELVQRSRAQIERFGYRVLIFDLGDLGFGEPFDVGSEQFRQRGDYGRYQGHRRPTRALHKPALIRAGLSQSGGSFVVYLDGDAVLLQPIDEIVGDYDVGVTVRPASRAARAQTEVRKLDGYVNAGVLFFRPGPGTDAFMTRWERATDELHNDQAALNSLLEPYWPLRAGVTLDVAGVRVRTFPDVLYNNYYLPKRWSSYVKDPRLLGWQLQLRRAKIVHLKGEWRRRHLRWIERRLLGVRP